MIIGNNSNTTSAHNRLFHFIIRVPKEESAFTYFQLESNEGLCFYSTLKSSLSQGYCDLDLKGDIALKGECLRLITKLQESYTIEFLLNEEIDPCE